MNGYSLDLHGYKNKIRKDTSRSGRSKTQRLSHTSKGKRDKYIITHNRITGDKPSKQFFSQTGGNSVTFTALNWTHKSIKIKTFKSRTATYIKHMKTRRKYRLGRQVTINVGVDRFYWYQTFILTFSRGLHNLLGCSAGMDVS